MNASTLILLLKAIDLVTMGITLAPAVREVFASITTSVRAMIVENRDPTLEEWDQLDTLRDRIHEAIQEA